MVIPAQALRRQPPLSPFCERQKHRGVTYGLGPAGYDIRIAETVRLWPGRFILASTIERFTMPKDMIGIVHDKSTWARLGIAVQNTVIEPNWSGFLTLELTMHAFAFRKIWAGTAIAQVIFHRLEEETDNPYTGKYQDQEAGPQKARMEPCG